MNRIIELLEDFGFYCTCPACIYDSDPIYSKLTIKNKAMLDLISDFDLHLHDYNVKQFRKQYVYLMKLLKENYVNFPCTELSVIQSYAMTTLEHTSRPAHTFQ